MKTCLHCGETFQRDFDPALGAGTIDGKSKNPKLISQVGSKDLFATEQDEIIVEYSVLGGKCPKCNKSSIILMAHEYSVFPLSMFNPLNIPPLLELSLYPFHNERPVSKEVPESIADDYKQATRISGISTKASATLARRCLQATLRNKFPEMGKKPNLKQEIDWVIKNGELEDEINEVLHKLRDAGNFGAHPSEDGLTQIYDLSQEDLEACFLLLDHLFDIFYVLPAKRKEKLSKLKNIPSSKK